MLTVICFFPSIYPVESFDLNYILWSKKDLNEIIWLNYQSEVIIQFEVKRILKKGS